MSWVRVAVASTDGRSIDQALQEVSSFHVYDVALEGPRFVEVRTAAGASSLADSGGAHDLKAEEVLDLISDCSLLVVKSLGFEAGGKIQIGWLTVYEGNMPVEKALQKLSRSPLFRMVLRGGTERSKNEGKDIQ